MGDANESALIDFYPTLSPIKCFLSGVSLAHANDAINLMTNLKCRGGTQMLLKRRFMCIKV